MISRRRSGVMRRSSATSLPNVVMPRRRSLAQVEADRAAARSLVDRVRTVRRVRRVAVRSAVARIRREAVVARNNRSVVDAAERRLVESVFLGCDGQTAFEDGSVSAGG